MYACVAVVVDSCGSWAELRIGVILLGYFCMKINHPPLWQYCPLRPICLCTVKMEVCMFVYIGGRGGGILGR